MKKWVVLVGGALAIVVALGYLVRPVGHIPPFDANRWQLAETALEGFCAGEVVVQTQSAARKPELAADCRVQHENEFSSDINLEHAIIGFCTSVSRAFGFSMEECKGIVAGNKLWPLYDGGFTQDWNSTWPYPGDRVLGPVRSDSRVGDRELLEREELER